MSASNDGPDDSAEKQNVVEEEEGTIEMDEDMSASVDERENVVPKESDAEGTTDKPLRVKKGKVCCVNIGTYFYFFLLSFSCAYLFIAYM